MHGGHGVEFRGVRYLGVVVQHAGELVHEDALYLPNPCGDGLFTARTDEPGKDRAGTHGRDLVLLARVAVVLHVAFPDHFRGSAFPEVTAHNLVGPGPVVLYEEPRVLLRDSGGLGKLVDLPVDHRTALRIGAPPGVPRHPEVDDGLGNGHGQELLRVAGVLKRAEIRGHGEEGVEKEVRGDGPVPRGEDIRHVGSEVVGHAVRPRLKALLHIAGGGEKAHGALHLRRLVDVAEHGRPCEGRQASGGDSVHGVH